MRMFLGLMLLPVAASIAFADGPKAAKPNIVVILADDLGYGDVHCNNRDRCKIATPNIDRLAAEGMRFTDGHSSSGVCSPSRYSLLTGRYHWRSRLQSSIVGSFGAPLIAADRMTIAGLVKAAGYRTACVGKWHLGWDWPIAEGQMALLSEPKANKAKKDGPAAVTEKHLAAWNEIFSKRIENGPTTRGFDMYFGTDVPNWPPFCFISNDRTVGIPTEFLPASQLTAKLASKQGPALKDWRLDAILDSLGDKAVEFIDASAKAKEPFLLYMPLTAPHTPIAVKKDFQGKSGLGVYGDFVMETDALVGRILDALEKAGVAGDTIVVFTSDNGCSPVAGTAELIRLGHFPSGIFRGFKADAWEGGHRVPYLVRWPGVVKGGSVCDQNVQQADLIATFAEILGTKLPDNAGEDSFSLLPLLKGGNRPVRENAVNASINGVPSVRQGSWTLIFGPGSGGWSKGEVDTPMQLYNLADDPGQAKNLFAAEPERVRQMQELLEKLIADGRSTPGPKQKNDVAVRRHPAGKK